MNVNRLILGYGVILAGMLLLVSCGGNKKETVPENAKKEPARVATVIAEPSLVEVAGTVRASDVAELAGRFGGFVSRVLVRPGNQVHKGELLVVIDDRNLQAQSDKLKSASEEVDLTIREARSQLEAAESQKQLATNTFERVRKVYEKKAASRQEFEEAEGRRKSADAAWQAATERVAQMESKRHQLDADLRDLEASLGYVRIAAPFDGVVTSIPADEGTFTNPGETLVIMERPTSYQVVFSVEEDLLSAVPEKQTVPVSIPNLSEKPLQATITEVSPSMDPGTRTFRVKAELEPQVGLRSGTSARVTLASKKGSSLWIPVDFLSRSQDLESVMVREGNRWHRVLVKSGREKDGKVEILSGLNRGDQIGLFKASS